MCSSDLVSEEAARKINTYESYVFNQYGGHAYDVLQAFVIEHF